MKNKIFQHIDNSNQLVFELQSGMTKRPAISPKDGGDGEWEKAKWLEEKIFSWDKNKKLSITQINAPDPRVSVGYRPNLLIVLPGNSERKLWIMSHLDVVPSGDLSLWHTDPFEATIDIEDADIIRGRGVEDNQQSIVSALLLLKALLEENATPDYTLAILLLADEETHNTYGIDYILNENPHLVAKNDLVLVPDFGSEHDNLIEIAEKCILWLEVIVLGKQCHASTPDAGINTLIVSSEMIVRVQEVENKLTKRNPIFQPDKTTITPTRHDANIPNINTIPGKEVFYIDCRITPEYNPQEIIDLIQDLGNDVAKKYGAEIQVKAVSTETVSKATDPNSEVVQKLKKSIFEVANIECSFCGAGGGTVASRIRNLDIPVAVWLSAIPNFHKPNEGSRISYAIRDAKVFTNLLFKN